MHFSQLLRSSSFRSPICTDIGSHIGWCLTLIFVLDLFTNVVQASSLTIEISDQRSKAAIAEAEVIVRSRDGREFRATSNARGQTVLSELSAGLYSLEVTKDSYQKIIEPSLRILSNKTKRLEVFLSRVELIVEDDVIILGRALNAEANAALSASVINREELRSATGSGSDVLRALDGLPGLFSSGEFASFSVRGRGPRDNLILVDGVPFENVVHFDQSLAEEEDAAGGGRFSVFAPNLVERADFEPGGWSAAYSGRSGSLLRLTIAEGNRETPAFSTRFDITGAEFTYDGPSYLADNTSVLFSARRYNFGNLFDAIDEEDIGEPILTDVIFKTSTELAQHHTLEFLSIYAPEEYSRDRDNVLASEGFEDVAIIDSEQDNNLNAVSWLYEPDNGVSFSNKLYFRYRDKSGTRQNAIVDGLDNNAEASELGLEDAVFGIDEEETEIGLRSDLEVPNALGTVKAGLRLAQIDADYQTSLSAPTNRYVFDDNDFRASSEQAFVVLEPAFVNSRYEAEELSYGAYVEQRAEFSSWQWRAGLRYDRDNLSDEDLFSPRFSLGYKFSNSLELTGTLGRFYQSPRILDRAQDPENFDLKSEQVDHISLGFVKYLTPQWRLLMEAYYQDLEDLIVEGDRTRNRLDNSGTGKNSGVDIVLSRQFAKGWSTTLNYSFNNSKIDEGQGSFDADFNRPHILQVGGAWEINERWKISSRWKFASGRPTDRFIVNSNVLGDGNPLRFSKQITDRNAERYGNFHSLNFRVDYVRDLRYVDLIAFLDVINAYGASNPDFEEFNPRTGELDAEEGSAFPLLGFRLEW